MFFGMNFNEVFNEKKDLFINDLIRASQSPNPNITTSFDLVFVLSGRGTALSNDADNLGRDFDINDDLERLQEGIRIANKINALRAEKSIDELTDKDYITPILYNGRNKHNQDLKIALKTKKLKYPYKLFRIIDMKTHVNTISQIESFKEYLDENNHSNVALVSSAYHLPRISRCFENVFIAHKKLKVHLFGVHKNEKRPGMIHDIRGEWSAMTNYSKSTNSMPAKISLHSHENIVF